jgi:hypothetical protein
VPPTKAEPTVELGIAAAGSPSPAKKVLLLHGVAILSRPPPCAESAGEPTRPSSRGYASAPLGRDAKIASSSRGERAVPFYGPGPMAGRRLGHRYVGRRLGWHIANRRVAGAKRPARAPRALQDATCPRRQRSRRRGAATTRAAGAGARVCRSQSSQSGTARPRSLTCNGPACPARDWRTIASGGGTASDSRRRQT